jgi:uncharacterized MAPEG superfamily protein
MANFEAPVGATVEIGSVVFAAFLVWASALVQHISNVVSRGAGYVVSDRAVAPEMTGFYGRATRTLSNNLESAIMYIPPTLVVAILGKAAGITHYAAFAYIAIRITFSVSYWLKIPLIRSLAWFAGMMCCFVMVYVAIIGLMP